MEILAVISCQKKCEAEFLKKANVISVGCGFKFVGGKKTPEIGIVVGVRKKVPASQLHINDILPNKIDGVVVDVVETSDIIAHLDPKLKYRPAIPGTSIGHKDITAGTFGCVVRKNDLKYILSNNHVLANSNAASTGDAIYQPGTADGGSSDDLVGTLDSFIPIHMGVGGIEPPTCPIATGISSSANFVAKVLGRKHRLYAVAQAEDNFVDAAIAFASAELSEEIPQIGKPAGLKDGVLGMAVQKYGRTTGYTAGEIIQVNTTVNVSYGSAGTAMFKGQFVTGPMSEPGDSGSAVLDMDRNLVGLLFAGSSTTMIFNPINKVFDLLGITL